MRWTTLKGLKKLSMQTLLSFAAQNVKKLARWTWSPPVQIEYPLGHLVDWSAWWRLLGNQRSAKTPQEQRDEEAEGKPPESVRQERKSTVGFASTDLEAENPKGLEIMSTSNPFCILA